MKRTVSLLVLALMLFAMDASATVWQVNVADFQFTPSTLTILMGDTVTWTNTLGFHGIHADCDSTVFGFAPASAPWTYTFVFNVATGIYPYHCPIHPMMMASVTVLDRPIWNVNVHNFAFTPANITVMQGDSVVWTNTEGFHNVHHTGNPSLFGNAEGNAPWVYGFRFNLPPATYNYICQVHLFQGSVHVLAPSAPSAPSELTIARTDTSSSVMQLRWKSVCGAAGYSIFRSPNEDAAVYPDSLGMTTDTSWVDVTTAVRNFYLVRALGL